MNDSNEKVSVESQVAIKDFMALSMLYKLDKSSKDMSHRPKHCPATRVALKRTMRFLNQLNLNCAQQLALENIL